MFNCDECGETSLPGVKPNKFVAETRDKNYITPKHGLVGVGWEIVKELDLCQPCHGLYSLESNEWEK